MGQAEMETDGGAVGQPQSPACNLIMKGGITSGVIYPLAIAEFARTYRLRGLGGASAGAIGAALAAAAEYGRAAGGFEVLHAVPSELGNGRLGRLFQPQPATRGLFKLMLAATGHDRPGPGRSRFGRVAMVLSVLIKGFPLAALLGLLPGIVLFVRETMIGDPWGMASAVIVTLIGFVVAMIIRLLWQLTRAVPQNLFGICRGIAVGNEDGFTDWLSDKIDAAAGLKPRTRPLTFGQLEGHAEHPIELRMVTTCLTQGTPYGLPFETFEFFYDPAEWSTLFPAYVMDAMNSARPARPEGASAQVNDRFEADETAGAAHVPALRRLPGRPDLPVIVATRLSLSFPMLISAIPIWIVDHAGGAAAFNKHWFTDGGFCSNFPVHMFDTALPDLPTFAINLATMGKGWQPAPDQAQNLVFATSNRSGLRRPYRQIPESGLAAIGGFAVGAFDTSRNWSDNSYLRYPGFRDRTILVKQSKSEGGLNLFMDQPTILGLAERGRTAAHIMVDRYTRPQFAKYKQQDLTLTAWDNHRWVRYRALIGTLPTFLEGFAKGRAVLALTPSEQASYHLSANDIQHAEAMLQKLDEAAAIAARLEVEHPAALHRLTEEPNPQARLRRIPQI